MNKKTDSAVLTVIATCCVLAISLWGVPVKANPLGGGQVPQIPAFLPFMTDVPMTEKLPIDGEWVVDTIRKRIRIEGGRAYAVDSWLHLFVLKIEPLMVVIQDIKRAGPGQYTGQDLPLMGAWEARIQPNGALKVTVAGALGPASYNLVPVKIDNQQVYDLEKTGQYTPGAPAQQPVYQPQQPGYQPQLQPVYQPQQPGYQPQQQPVYQPQQPGYQPQQQPVYRPQQPVQQPQQPVAQPAPQPGTELANCQSLDVDPATGQVVCMD